MIIIYSLLWLQYIHWYDYNIFIDMIIIYSLIWLKYVDLYDYNRSMLIDMITIYWFIYCHV